LIHAPTVPEKGKIGEFWTILEGLVEDGTLKGTSLGVSNFRPQDLEDVLKVAKIMPVVNREFFPTPSITRNTPIMPALKYWATVRTSADSQKWSSTHTSSPTPNP